jgi:hypothetical protein
VQIDAYGAMSGADRYRVASQMSDWARDVALEGLRDRNPTLGQDEILRLYIERVLGWRVPKAARPADASRYAQVHAKRAQPLDQPDLRRSSGQMF